MSPARVVANVRLAHPVHPEDGVVPDPVHLGVQGPGHVLTVLDPVDDDGLISLDDGAEHGGALVQRQRAVSLTGLLDFRRD